MKRWMTGIFAMLLMWNFCAVAESIGIIGGADGPTAIYVTEEADAAEDAIEKAGDVEMVEIVGPVVSAQVTQSAQPEDAKTSAQATPSTPSPDAQAQTDVSPSASPSPAASATEPVGRLDGIIIGIDPGHQAQGNSDTEPVAPGSSEMKAKVASGTAGTSTGIAEYVTDLEISLKLRDALQALGCTVYMTRETHDVDISNMERAVMMNELGADLVLRLHCDGSTDSSANGIGMFVRETGDAQQESEEAANVLLESMCESTGARARGVFLRDTYTGLNWSTVPCILVEMGFMSNPEEDEKLNDPAYQDLLVEGMVEGICRYFQR